MKLFKPFILIELWHWYCVIICKFMKLINPQNHSDRISFAHFIKAELGWACCHNDWWHVSTEDLILETTGWEIGHTVIMGPSRISQLWHILAPLNDGNVVLAMPNQQHCQSYLYRFVSTILNQMLWRISGEDDECFNGVLQNHRGST